MAVIVYSCKLSQIGRDKLEAGGHAVDAAIATLFCLGVVNFESSGIGGGGFMTVYDKAQKKAEVYDYRELGPAGMNVGAYERNKTTLRYGKK